VLQLINTQLNDICSRKRPSILRASTKEEIANFDFKRVCLEFKERAPISYAFLMTFAAVKKEKAPEWLPSVAVSGSILLKQRNSHMNGCATVIGILKSGNPKISRIGPQKRKNTFFFFHHKNPFS